MPEGYTSRMTLLYLSCCLCVLFLVLLVLYRRSAPVRTYDDIVQMAMDFRQESLWGVPLSFAGFRVFANVVRGLDGDKKRGREWYSFEKWLAENDYLVQRCCQRVRRASFHRLPCAHGAPRVVTLARYLAAHTADVSVAGIRPMVKAVQEYTSLTWPEMCGLPAALMLATLERMESVADASLFLGRMRKAASGPMRDDYDRYDAYRYYRRERGDMSVTEYDAVSTRFHHYLLHLETTVKQCIGALNALEKWTDEGIMTLSDTCAHLDAEGVASQTVLAYLVRISACARRYRVSESMVVQAAKQVARAWDEDFAIALFDSRAVRVFLMRGVAPSRRGTRPRERLYVAVVLFLTSLFSALPLAFGLGSIEWVLIPLVWLAALAPVEETVRWFWPKRPVCDCRMGYTAVPDEGRTVVIVSRYVDGPESLAEGAMHLRQLAGGTSDDNVYYCLLMDFPPSDVVWSDDDEALVQSIRAYAAEDGLIYSVRARRKDGERYVAWERKRGALQDYMQALTSGDGGAFAYMSYLPRDCRLAVLLDEDSRLMPNAVRDAVNHMLHPANRRYDLMTFDAAYRAESVDTVYALRYLDTDARPAYALTSDTYADAFDAAIYCGKGIVRVDRYVEVLRGRFPAKRILSHDLIEGAMLRSGRLSQRVYEDAPRHFAAHAARLSRWQRGDVLLAPYLARVVRNEEGKPIANDIRPIYRWLLFANLVRIVRPIALWCMLLLGVLSDELSAGVLALSLLVYPHVSPVLHTFAPYRHRPRYVAMDIGRALWGMLHDVVLLPFYAWNGARVLVQTLWQSMRARNMLTWRPFAATQKGGGIRQYMRMMMPSRALAMACAALTMDWRWVVAGAAYWLVTYALYLRIPLGRPHLSPKYHDAIRRIMADTYRYFVDCAPHGLVMDNLQVAPPCSGLDMTSPTDLGFSILADVCAVVAGLDERAWVHMARTLTRISELPTWRGHLYNWYSVKGEPLTDAVSSVDCGNFVCCLVVAEALARREGHTEVARLCGKLLTGRFADFVDAERRMLCIVVHAEDGRKEGNYDHLASEARLAYYLAVAEGLGTRLYDAIGRECTSYRGNTLLSWGGTAFEYLLPRLFVRAPVGSLLRHTERNVSVLQAHSPIMGVYGVSESGYYAFNDQMRYRYRANGLARLSMQPDCGEDAVAPYASALTAAYLPNRAAINMARLQSMGTYGQYGFYEALHHGKVVQCHMAHHQGMLLAAWTNATHDDVLCELFMQSPRVSAAMLLAAEPYDKGWAYHRTLKGAKPENAAPKRFVYAYPDRVAHVLTSDRTQGVYLSDGRQELMFDRILVGNLACVSDGRKEHTTLVSAEGESDCVSPYPGMVHRGARYEFEVTGGSAIYRNVSADVSEEIRLLPDGGGELRDICVRNHSEATKVYKVFVMQSLSLCDEGAQLSHRAYRDMFVETQIADGVASRRIEGGEPYSDTFWSVRGLENTEYTTNRLNLGTRNVTEWTYIPENTHEYPDEGHVLYPCIAVWGTCVVPPEGTHHIYVCTSRGGVGEAKVHDEHYRSLIMGYLGLAQCLSDTAAWWDKYADRETAYAVASVLLDNWTEDACADLPRYAIPKVLPYTADFASSLRNSVAVRLTKMRCAVQLARPADDRKGELCAQVAGAVGDSLPLFLPAAATVWRNVRYGASVRPSMPPVTWTTGEGGYVGRAYYVNPYGTQTLMPYANVVANGQAGFVLTENGGGYFFGKNSREDKWTAWRNDSMRDTPTHLVAATDGHEHWRLNDARYCLVCHDADSTSFSTRIGTNEVTLTYRLAGGRVQIVVTQTAPLWVYLSLTPLLDWRTNACGYVKKRSPRGLVVENRRADKRLVLSVDHGWAFEGADGLTARIEGKESMAPTRMTSVGLVTRDKRAVFSFGGAEGPIYRLDLPTSLVGQPTVHHLLQGLWRQMVHSRLMAKTSLYQCGGAWGYRDQLQDLECYMWADKAYCRRALLDFAAHQYAEGDVMHWWHPPRTGVRTHITDDRLFLASACIRYVRMTDDDTLWEEKVPFLLSETLPQDVASRYETPTISREAYSMREHVRRAVISVLRFGAHDLLLLGGGDWNDGINDIGRKGVGESVWLTMFAYDVVGRSIEYLPQSADLLRGAMRRMKVGIAHAFFKDRFAAYVTDDGRMIGAGNGGCALYLMTQSFAVLSGAVDRRQAEMCMQTARRLVDYEYGTVSLFAPPFAHDERVGYIADYPQGIRENGGQYTHAVVWYIRALIRLGEVEYAYEVLRMINPVERCRHKKDAAAYRVEPYVLAADVYTAKGYRGQGGWTWYTGSAGWLYRVILEDFYGVNAEKGRLFIRPHLPHALAETELSLVWQDKRMFIYFREGEEASLCVDGKPVQYLTEADADKHVVATVAKRVRNSRTYQS